MKNKKVLSCALAAMMAMQSSGVVFAGETSQLSNVKTISMLDKKINLVENSKERISTSIEDGKFVEAVYNKETKILTQKIYDKRGGSLLSSEVWDLSKPSKVVDGYTWCGFGYGEEKDYYYLKSCDGSVKLPARGNAEAHNYMNKVDEIWRAELGSVAIVGATIISSVVIKNGKVVPELTKAVLAAVLGEKWVDFFDSILDYHGLCKEAERLFEEVPMV